VLLLLIDALFCARLVVMTAVQTVRDRVRAEVTREIKAEARRQLADEGPQRLSLRAVARQLGMVSSALYRYFRSRDELLTALIIDAYNALGESAERAVAGVPRADIRGRWRACCHAVRDWALAHPHEYALIYGSPVPGYRAPQETIGPASRVAMVFGRLLADGWSARAADPGGSPAAPAASTRPFRQEKAGAPTQRSDQEAAWRAPAAGQPSPRSGEPLPEMLKAQAEEVAAAIAPGIPAPVMARGLIAWTQLFGMVSFELFGQLVGSVDPADAFFGYAVDQMGDYVGLPS
jgi:AcrR family transcriptional regulator